MLLDKHHGLNIALQRMRYDSDGDAAAGARNDAQPAREETPEEGEI